MTTAAAALHEACALVVGLDQSQPLPEYEQGSAKPSISEVRLVLTQPYTAESGAALELLTRRRAATDARPS